MSNNPSIINGLSQEDYISYEGIIKYDIKFYMNIPDILNGTIKIYVNLEAQKDDFPGYDIATRGIYYAARMLSFQLTQEFNNNVSDKEKYGNLKKVYSIWFCTETSLKKSNTVERYYINKEFLYGYNNYDTKYDLLEVIIINLSKIHNKCDNQILNMLTDLLDETINSTNKIVKPEEYGVPVTSDVLEGVSVMTSYSERIAREAIEKGLCRGLIKGKEQGESLLGSLISKLLQANRIDDVKKASENAEYRKKLYIEFGLDEDKL